MAWIFGVDRETSEAAFSDKFDCTVWSSGSVGVVDAMYDLAVTLDVSAVATQNSQDHTDHNHFRNSVHTTKFDLVQTVFWFGIVPQEIPWILYSGSVWSSGHFAL